MPFPLLHPINVSRRIPTGSAIEMTRSAGTTPGMIGLLPPPPPAPDAVASAADIARRAFIAAVAPNVS
eukprot:29644-Pelagococcus_subviridis.AAC.5